MRERLPDLLSRRRLLLVAGVAAVGLLVLSFGRMLLARQELGQREQSLRAEITRLQEENARLSTELAYLQSDAGVERLAREQLGWARSGETAVEIVGAERPRPTPAAAATRLGDPTPNWRRWWKLFFGG